MVPRVPLHCTASGKLYLSTLPRSRWEPIIQKLNLEPKAKNTITDPRKLIEEITKIAETKVSIDNEELFEGVIAVAVPITDTKGRFYSSLAIQAPAYRFNLSEKHIFLPLLQEAARNLSTIAED